MNLPLTITSHGGQTTITGPGSLTDTHAAIAAMIGVKSLPIEGQAAYVALVQEIREAEEVLGLPTEFFDPVPSVAVCRRLQRLLHASRAEGALSAGGRELSGPIASSGAASDTPTKSLDAVTLKAIMDVVAGHAPDGCGNLVDFIRDQLALAAGAAAGAAAVESLRQQLAAATAAEAATLAEAEDLGSAYERLCDLHAALAADVADFAASFGGMSWADSKARLEALAAAFQVPGAPAGDGQALAAEAPVDGQPKPLDDAPPAPDAAGGRPPADWNPAPAPASPAADAPPPPPPPAASATPAKKPRGVDTVFTHVVPEPIDAPNGKLLRLLMLKPREGEATAYRLITPKKLAIARISQASTLPEGEQWSAEILEGEHAGATLPATGSRAEAIAWACPLVGYGTESAPPATEHPAFSAIEARYAARVRFDAKAPREGDGKALLGFDKALCGVASEALKGLGLTDSAIESVLEAACCFLYDDKIDEVSSEDVVRALQAHFDRAATEGSAEPVADDPPPATQAPTPQEREPDRATALYHRLEVIIYNGDETAAAWFGGVEPEDLPDVLAALKARHALRDASNREVGDKAIALLEARIAAHAGDQEVEAQDDPEFPSFLAGLSKLELQDHIEDLDRQGEAADKRGDLEEVARLRELVEEAMREYRGRDAQPAAAHESAPAPATTTAPPPSYSVIKAHPRSVRLYRLGASPQTILAIELIDDETRQLLGRVEESDRGSISGTLTLPTGATFIEPAPTVYEAITRILDGHGIHRIEAVPPGVTLDEYQVWRDHVVSKGEFEHVDPAEFKRRRDAGMYTIPKEVPGEVATEGKERLSQADIASLIKRWTDRGGKYPDFREFLKSQFKVQNSHELTRAQGLELEKQIDEKFAAAAGTGA